MPIIKIETDINSPIDIVFDLSRSIDLHRISTQQTNEEAIAGVTSGLIGMNEWVTWRARHFGVYQKLTSRITSFEKPFYFVDEMEKGIFQYFKHEHIFQEIGEQTRMIDVFDYGSPLGIFGKVAYKLFLEEYMRKFLEKRNNTIKAFAESNDWKKILKN